MSQKVSGLIAWWVRNPVAANLLMVVIVVSGLFAWRGIEKELFPPVELPTISVQYIWPGAAPKDIDQQVINRVEAAIRNIDNLYRYNSQSTEGFGSITLTAAPRSDISKFKEDIRDALDGITSMPRDLEPPRFREMKQLPPVMILALSGDIDERPFLRLANQYRDELLTLSNVNGVSMFGGKTEEVTIEVTEANLERYALTFGETAEAIRGSSLNVSTGQIETSTGDIKLRSENLADSVFDFEKIVLREEPSGARLTLADVARVTDGYEDVPVKARHNGSRAVTLEIEPTDRLFITATSDQVRDWLNKTIKELPQGVSLEIFVDTADAYRDQISLIFGAALQGLVLVMLILFLTLRFTIALWVTVGIGIAFLGAFIMLPPLDVSMNLLSLFAFLLVLGIVVDDAIVVGESVHHHRTDLLFAPQQAAIAGTTAVVRPVVFSVLTTIVAFTPWAFLSGPQSDLLRHLSAVIAFALIFSLVESFLILPAHLSNLRGRSKPLEEGKNVSEGWLKKTHWQVSRIQPIVASSLVAFAKKSYLPILKIVLARRYTTSLIFLVGFAVSVTLVATGWVRFFFFAQIDADIIQAEVILPEGVAFQRAENVMDRLTHSAETLKSRDEVEDAFTVALDNYVTQWIKLPIPSEREKRASEIAKEYLSELGEIPDAEKIDVDYTFNSSEAILTFVLSHQDSAILSDATDDLRTYLTGYEDVLYVRDNRRGQLDELNFQLRPGAEALGIDLASISRQIRQAYYGEEVQRLPREYGDVRVMLRYPKEDRERLSSLDDLRIRTRDGRSIPVDAVADAKVMTSTQRIVRRDGNRMFEVWARVNDSALSGVAETTQEEFIPNLVERYPGLKVLKGGVEEQTDQFRTEATQMGLLALLVIYCLLAVAFKSYFLPVIIMSAIPFAFMGAIFGHLIFKIPIDMFSFFGMAAAAGVVVNDNLVLIDYILRREAQGEGSFEAITSAAVNRFRPIFLTTVTTFVGLMPIMAEQSVQAEFLKPSVLSLAFGVFFALFVSLLLVPCLYLVGRDLSSLWRSGDISSIVQGDAESAR